MPVVAAAAVIPAAQADAPGQHIPQRNPRGERQGAEGHCLHRPLDPQGHRFAIGSHDRIELWNDDTRIAAGIFVVRTFPATHPEEYLSVRGWGETGEEVELGMIRSLDGWSDANATIVRTALARRSLVRTISRVHGVKLAHGYLDLDVETDAGRQAFTMRWTQSQAIDYGADGKMLIDTEDNRWVVPNVDDLPKPDRERFMQYVYW